MRTFFIFIISFLWSAAFSSVEAQLTCDIATNGISFSPSVMSGNGTTTITFDVFNDSGESSCSYPVNSVLVVVTLPASGLDFNAFVTPSMGTYFNWSYDAVENIILGINHTAIGDGQGEIVQASLMVTGVPSNIYPSCRTVNISILNNPDGPNFPSNNEGNDNSEATITITPTNGTASVNCISAAVQPTPPFMAPTCSAPVITFDDTPAGFTCSGTRVWSFAYSSCTGCPFNSFTWTYTYTVTENVAPDITGAIDPVTVPGCDSNAAPAAVTTVAALEGLGLLIADNCTADGDLSVTSSDVVAGPCPVVVTRTYTVTDLCGNFSNYVQTINVVDNIIPVVNRLGDATVYICQNEIYTDAGATALDNCNGDITGSITVTSDVNTAIAGTYTVTFNVSDACGNAAVAVSRTVIVRPHPTATISGTATVLQNAPVAPVVTFTGSGGTGPYTFDYTKQFNSDPPTYHTGGPGNIVTVAQSNAVVGVFTYTLTRVTDFYGCQYNLPAPQPTAIITVISACDLSPSIPRPTNGSFVNAQAKDGVVQFTNAGPGPTSGTLTFRISKIANFGVSIPGVSGTYGGLSCQNSSFTITSGLFFTTVTTNAIIPAGGNLRLGYVMTAVGTGGSNGNLTATVINGTGNDNNNNNNKAIRTFVIN